MLIVIAIIGILASVAIPQYSQYKIRGYDAQTKQALKNMHLLCNAYWLDTSTLQGCDLPKIKEPTYGFNQNADVVATLPPSPRDNFCASAKHNDSPNKFSIDSAALITSGSGCGGSGGGTNISSGPKQTFESYKPECKNDGLDGSYDQQGNETWLLVGPDGRRIGCDSVDCTTNWQNPSDLNKTAVLRPISARCKRLPEILQRAMDRRNTPSRDPHFISSGWTPTHTQAIREGYKLVYSHTRKANVDFDICEAAKMNGQPMLSETCAQYNETYSYNRYNFETGVWSKD